MLPRLFIYHTTLFQNLIKHLQHCRLNGFIIEKEYVLIDFCIESRPSVLNLAHWQPRYPCQRHGFFCLFKFLYNERYQKKSMLMMNGNERKKITIKHPKKKRTMETVSGAILNKFRWQFLVCVISILIFNLLWLREPYSKGATVLFHTS